MDYNVKNNEARQRFEVSIDGQLAVLEYRFYKGSMALMHTAVPTELEGKGVGSALARYAFGFAKDNHFPVMVYCSFVADFLKKHPEYEAQLDRTYHKQ